MVGRDSVEPRQRLQLKLSSFRSIRCESISRFWALEFGVSLGFGFWDFLKLHLPLKCDRDPLVR
jgi:hypothetical protein